jgi:hypothetical protein
MATSLTFANESNFIEVLSRRIFPGATKKKLSPKFSRCSSSRRRDYFFGGLILSGPSFDVVCVTDGNADGSGAEREKHFQKACRALGVNKFTLLKMPDIFNQRLDVNLLHNKLSEVGKYSKVFTHSPLGEYGHPHHQDVSFATHSAFKNKCSVFSVAYNIFPDVRIKLSLQQYKKKTAILWNIYSGETKRLINYLPARSEEGFTEISFKEVEALYSYLTHKGPINPSAIKTYRWLVPYLQEGGGNIESRLF